MSAQPAVLCALDSVLADFLPPDLMRELQALLPGLFTVPVSEAWNTDPAFFERHRPEILITGWGAPRLPDRIEKVPGLRYLCHLGGSVRGILPRRLLEEGLLVSNWGTCHARTVAECALFLVLSCLRRATATSRIMHLEGEWAWPDRVRPESLYGRRVGLHGFGAVARSLLPLLKPFDVSVSAYSHGVPEAVFAEAGVRCVDSLEALFSESDILVEVEAATAPNIGTVRESHLRMLPPGGVFVNVGRAAVVDEAALLKVAIEGSLQIGLDVYHQEPLPGDSCLRGLPNVCLLAHQAGPTPDRQRDCGRFALDNLADYLAGRPLRGAVNLEQYDRAT